MLEFFFLFQTAQGMDQMEFEERHVKESNEQI